MDKGASKIENMAKLRSSGTVADEGRKPDRYTLCRFHASSRIGAVFPWTVIINMPHGRLNCSYVTEELIYTVCLKGTYQEMLNRRVKEGRSLR
ncbi:hypothetical protein DFP87_10841 [Achromobacter marplatensis]|uniref:Uncharacterized protein n=1 Tax=Achromobacter marplatensis TaxID=470868 RepID=A0ABX9G9U6_9BURK|nr:hypothetical protein DFP87_10841 [Achromobacter marplatensis]CAB3696252.1 hypothetical protein LMG26219_05101 [Achromobacter marplatensis]